MVNTEETYRAGYDAFENGTYSEANRLADICLKNSAPTSYWHTGAQGLKCWIASFSRNFDELKKNAFHLLNTDTGEDKPWFDGLVALNLGLAYSREGAIQKAQAMFSEAKRSYSQQKLHANQPQEWQYVLDYFATLASWLEKNNLAVWQKYLEELERDCEASSQLCQQLQAAAHLMARFASGENVKQEAVELLTSGVSRTFLCPVLLDYHHKEDI